MYPYLPTRLAAVVASIVISLAIVQSVAMIGYPAASLHAGGSRAER
jgi:hypothetical protein